MQSLGVKEWPGRESAVRLLVLLIKTEGARSVCLRGKNKSLSFSKESIVSVTTTIKKRNTFKNLCHFH